MTDKTKTKIAIAVIAYLAIGCLSYGHAWNRGTFWKIENPQATDIAMSHQFGSLACGLFWPLYWSVMLFEVRP